jgi:23S rRNA (guanosine2251-2'-O)-methyltransferase
MRYGQTLILLPSTTRHARDMSHKKPQHQKPQHHRPPSRREQEEDGPVRLFGIHAVAAALANPGRSIDSLLLTENAENRLAETIAARNVKPQRTTPRDLDRLLGADTVHQGAMLETSPLEEPTLEELAAASATSGPLIVLDQVTDPHNVGAILRSAAVLGSAGLIMTRRHSPPLGGTLAKAASGGLDVVPVALVGNLARALEELGELGVHKVGLDGDGETAIGDVNLSGAVALVLGAEGKGLRRLTREGCDVLARVPYAGAFASLNVSNAAAVALYAAAETRRRG